MRLLNVIVVLLLIPSAAVAQQQGSAPTMRTLRGVVLTASEVPLPRVRVVVTRIPAADPPVLTDERGQFTIRVKDADSVRLTFTKARYAVVNVDMRRAELDAAATTGMRVRLSLGGAISGQVRDRSGAPVSQVSVTARQVWPASQSEVPLRAVTTNDLGEFRFGGLAAGVYTVSVRPVAAFPPASVPEPASEQSVNVSLGAEVGGLDVTIDVPSQLTGRNTDRKPAESNATGALRGRVVTLRGAPIAGAIVQASGQSGFFETAETDARGRYVISRLVSGNYRVEAFKRGYITPTPGQGRSAIDFLLASEPPGNRVVTVGPAQTVDASDLILGRGASISGAIVDEFGEPMQDVSVFALELRVVGGQTRALRVSSEGTMGRTDDRGRYRVYGLQPGTYVIQATAGDVLPGSDGYVPFFYPSTPSIDVATPTKLDIDEAVSGIDLTLSPQPVRRIRGTLTDPAGSPPERTTVTLTARGRSGGIQTEPARTSTNTDGTFGFDNVPLGAYVVEATANGRAVPGAKVAISRQFASAPLTIGDDEPPPVRLQLSFGATLMGSVVYEAIPDLTAPYSAIRLSTVPARFDFDPLVASDSSSFALLSDNTFEYRGVFGNNFLSVRPRDANWYVKSITYKGQDLADSSFDFGSTETFRDIEIVVSGAGAAVAGRVTDERAAPVRDYSVAVFSTDRSKWAISSRWLKTVRPTMDGTFRLSGLVPGDYWIVAVDRLAGSEVVGDLQDPDVLESFASRAVRIALGEGQTQNLTLRLVRR